MDLSIPTRPVTPDTSRSPSPSPSTSYSSYGGSLHDPKPPTSTLYFGYGSNMWQHQMLSRCPNVTYLGVGRLKHWRWQINTNGVANIVEAPPAPYSPATTRWLGPLMRTDDLREDNERTYGFVYELGEGDEGKLDGFEDVVGSGEQQAWGQPATEREGSYTKEYINIEYWPKPGNGQQIDIGQKPRRARALIYVDRVRINDGKATGSYTYKMNEAVQDALGEGIPESYINSCIRPYIATVDKRESISGSIEAAMRSGVDIKTLIEEVETRMAMVGAKEEGRVKAVVPGDILSKYCGENGQSIQQDAVPIAQSEQVLESVKRRRALTLA